MRTEIEFDIPKKERALILQGGGSLGAYEAGAYRALYEFLSNLDNNRGINNSSTFDIIAGTSIGAINAAVLVSYVIENQTYEGSADRLIEFWNYLSKESVVEKNPIFKSWWDYMHMINRNIATGEAARRYYASKEFAYFGVPNVFHPQRPWYDNKFFDLDNTWYRYSNEPLKRSLEKFAKFPIATTKEKNQPRLLLVTVDVAEGVPVTFDSYPQEDGSRKTEYGEVVDKNGKKIGFKYLIRYDSGITSDHVIASGSFPLNFDYARIEVERRYKDMNTVKSIVGSPSQTSTGIPNSNENYKYDKGNMNELRYFWDGGLLTNTPLWQLVLLHRKYWYKVWGLKDQVPRLGICIINLNPSIQEEIPTDRDGVINRNNDITFSDRSQKEQEVLLLISEYVSLVRKLIFMSKENGIKQEIIDQLMNQNVENIGFVQSVEKYSDIIEGRFQIDELIRINRSNDENTISNKIFDFSKDTIRLLLEQGYNDAHRELKEMILQKV